MIIGLLTSTMCSVSSQAVAPRLNRSGVCSDSMKCNCPEHPELRTVEKIYLLCFSNRWKIAQTSTNYAIKNTRFCKRFLYFFTIQRKKFAYSFWQNSTYSLSRAFLLLWLPSYSDASSQKSCCHIMLAREDATDWLELDLKISSSVAGVYRKQHSWASLPTQHHLRDLWSLLW